MSTEPLATSANAATPAPAVTRAATVLMSVAGGALVANLYYAQPVVALIGHEFGMAPAFESFVVTASQLGYALGLVLLVPLGDVTENRRLILLTMAAAVVALLALASAPTVAALLAAIFAVGLVSVAAQMIVPLAASLAPPQTRGRVVGNIMTGVLAGILLARPVSSFLAGTIGWRGVFVGSAVLLAALIALGARLLPRRVPTQRLSYGQLIASLGTLFATQPVLRRRAFYHAAMFAAFGIFWTGAPILLLREPFALSPEWVALFTLSGVLGVAAAPVAGRIADRGHSRAGTLGALALAVAAMVLAFVGGASLAALVVAGILLDLAVQANLVIGQREIFQLDETIRSRLNAVYMTTFFLGGALGSSLTSPVLAHAGWGGVALLAAAFPLAALVYFLVAEPRRER